MLRFRCFNPYTLGHPPEYPPAIHVNYIPMSETWGAMESLVSAGASRYIGVSNFNVQLLADMMGYCRLRPFANQIELHPHLSQDSIIKWCRQNFINIIAYSPFGSPGYVELQMDLLMGQGALEEPTIQEIARKHNKSPAQVILRWHIQRDTVPIFKTSSPVRLDENLNLFDFELTQGEVCTLSIRVSSEVTV
jgi:diketogulonate reductase-like aldo/keto reductase